MEVCTTITNFEGRGFKKSLIQNMLDSEDTQFMDEIVHNHWEEQQKTKPKTNRLSGLDFIRLIVQSQDQQQSGSEDEESYASEEESSVN